MPIELITGTPGAGKTLKALQRALTVAGVSDQSSFDAIQAGLKNAKRRVVVCGVEGLKPGLFDTIEDPQEWQDLDDGTLVVVDEAWKWWGSHINSIRNDPKFLALAEHRHRGFDMILTCQMPGQLQRHVLGLIGTHVHVTRKFGTNTTVTYEWSSVKSNPNSKAVRGEAIETIWHHPKPIFDLYQSATMHTIKRKFPLKVLLIPVVAVCVLGLIGLGIFSILHLYKNSDFGKDAAKADKIATGGGGGTGTAGKAAMSKAEYASRLLPRFATLPGSAPLYDERTAATEPELYCMSSEAGEGADGYREASVTCLTEQGTRYDIAEGEARRVARHGTPYNHFKTPRRERENRSPEAAAEPQTPRSAATVLSGPQIAAYGDIGIGSK